MTELGTRKATSSCVWTGTLFRAADILAIETKTTAEDTKMIEMEGRVLRIHGIVTAYAAAIWDFAGQGPAAEKKHRMHLSATTVLILLPISDWN